MRTPASRSRTARSRPSAVRSIRRRAPRRSPTRSRCTTAPSDVPVRQAGLIPGELTLLAGGPPRPGSLEDVERPHVQRVLAESATLDEAAARLGINSTTLWRKRKRWVWTDPDRKLT